MIDVEASINILKMALVSAQIHFALLIVSNFYHR